MTEMMKDRLDKTHRHYQPSSLALFVSLQPFMLLGSTSMRAPGASKEVVVISSNQRRRARRACQAAYTPHHTTPHAASRSEHIGFNPASPFARSIFERRITSRTCLDLNGRFPPLFHLSLNLPSPSEELAVGSSSNEGVTKIQIDEFCMGLMVGWRSIRLLAAYRL